MATASGPGRAVQREHHTATVPRTGVPRTRRLRSVCVYNACIVLWYRARVRTYIIHVRSYIHRYVPTYVCTNVYYIVCTSSRIDTNGRYLSAVDDRTL